MKEDKAIEKLFEENLFELANVFPRISGLPHIIWFSDNSESKLPRHLMRCKLRLNGKHYPISVQDPISFIDEWPKHVSTHEFKLIQTYIVKNREAIARYWDSGESAHYGTGEFLRELKPL